MSHKRFSLIFWVILAAYPLCLGVFSQIRPVDGDEGYYASAARLVAEGQTPYVDFFYPQMPVLPYVYAPFYKLVGSSLLHMRLLSVALAALGLLLWGLLLRARFADHPMFVIGGLLLVALNPYLISWQVTVKTYALANLGVFGALWAIDRGIHSRRLVWFLAAGLFAGLVVGSRLLYLPWAGSLLLALVWIRWRQPRVGLTYAGVTAAGAGLLLGLAPVIRSFLSSPELFKFNNLDYHRLRFSPLHTPGGPDTNQAVAALLVLGRALLLNPYMVLLLLLALAGWLAVRRSTVPADQNLKPLAVVAGLGLLVHTVTCLLPDPAYSQYFTSPLGPLLAPLAVLGVREFARRFGRPTILVSAVIVLGVTLSFVDLGVRRTGMDWAEVWDREHLAAVSAAIEERTEPDDYVMAFWSGYVFETGRRYVPGMENHFALGVSEKLTLEQKIAYHVVGKEMLLKMFLTKAPKIVVLGAWMHEVNTTLPQDNLPLILKELDANYEIDWMKGETKILVRRPGPGLKL